MPKSTPQKEHLPGLEVAPVARNLKSRNAFGRVPRAEYFSVDASTFSDVTEVELAAITPERCMLPRLYGMHSGRSVSGLSLNEAEYEAIVRHPGAFTVAVSNRTELARTLDTNPERKAGAVSRSVIHAHQSKSERARKITSNLEAEYQALARLLKEMRTPGYAHMSEAEMRILAETTRSSFDNILRVVGHQAGWNHEQSIRANKALNARLFGPYHQAFAFWQDMTSCAAQYTHKKIVLFKNRITS